MARPALSPLDLYLRDLAPAAALAPARPRSPDIAHDEPRRRFRRPWGRGQLQLTGLLRRLRPLMRPPHMLSASLPAAKRRRAARIPTRPRPRPRPRLSAVPALRKRTCLLPS